MNRIIDISIIHSGTWTTGPWILGNVRSMNTTTIVHDVLRRSVCASLVPLLLLLQGLVGTSSSIQLDGCCAPSVWGINLKYYLSTHPIAFHAKPIATIRRTAATLDVQLPLVLLRPVMLNAFSLWGMMVSAPSALGPCISISGYPIRYLACSRIEKSQSRSNNAHMFGQSKVRAYPANRFTA